MPVCIEPSPPYPHPVVLLPKVLCLAVCLPGDWIGPTQDHRKQTTTYLQEEWTIPVTMPGQTVTGSGWILYPQFFSHLVNYRLEETDFLGELPLQLVLSSISFWEVGSLPYSSFGRTSQPQLEHLLPPKLVCLPP